MPWTTASSKLFVDVELISTTRATDMMGYLQRRRPRKHHARSRDPDMTLTCDRTSFARRLTSSGVIVGAGRPSQADLQAEGMRDPEWLAAIIMQVLRRRARGARFRARSSYAPAL